MRFAFPAEAATSLAALGYAGMKRYATSFRAAQFSPLDSRIDVRAYVAPLALPNGTTTEVHFTLSPNDVGDWVITSW